MAQKMDMGFGIPNIRSSKFSDKRDRKVYNASGRSTENRVGRQLQGLLCNQGIVNFWGEGNVNHQLGSIVRGFVHKRI